MEVSNLNCLAFGEVYGMYLMSTKKLAELLYFSAFLSKLNLKHILQPRLATTIWAKKP